MVKPSGGLGGAAEYGMAEGLRLIPTKWAELGDISIELEEVGSQVTLLGTHLMDAPCNELPKAHEWMGR